MRKIIAVAVAGLMSASVVQASISVNWFTGNGIDAPLGGALPSGAMVQLIWTPDSLIGALDPNTPTATAGNDILLQTDFTTFNGLFAFSGAFNDGSGALLGINESTLLAGYVYVRVFSSGAPMIGDYFGLSSLVGNPLNDQDPTAGSPDFVDLSPNDSVPFDAWTAIVPEPSVLAFLGIGAALVAVRRMRRS